MPQAPPTTSTLPVKSVTALSCQRGVDIVFAAGVTLSDERV